ncbi:MAG: DinB family protein [Longimicrobiales bacterium]
MDKKALSVLWDQVRQKYGVYLRLLEAIPGDQYQSHPIKGMRSAAELVVHVSGGIVRDITQGVAKGEIKSNAAAEANNARAFTSSADAVAFARRCWKEADTAVAAIGDPQLAGMVKAWGSSLPGSACMHILSDELVHHRGQLYVLTRALGGEPPFLWSYGENATEFKPKP